MSGWNQRYDVDEWERQYRRDRRRDRAELIAQVTIITLGGVVSLASGLIRRDPLAGAIGGLLFAVAVIRWKLR